jgi:SsrA-binding protein
MAKSKKQSGEGDQKPKGVRIANRKAFHDYHIDEKIECGVELLGTEVKSLRAGQAKIDEAYARVEGDQVFLVGANIALYPQAAEGMQHNPTRKRRLLLHRRQIHQLQQRIQQKGKTLVPLAMYFHRGWAKVELGVAEGKKNYDKREDLRKKDHQRDMQRAMRRGK